MTTRVGDHIIVDSQKVGRPPREGEILEMIEATFGTRYRVLWSDGHESTFRPSGGSVRTTREPTPRAETSTAKDTGAKKGRSGKKGN